MIFWCHFMGRMHHSNSTNGLVLPRNRSRARATLAVLGLVLTLAARAADVPTLLKERLASVVAIEFVVQTESERRPVSVLGTVVDDQGDVMIPGSAIPPTVGLDQILDFKAYPAGGGDGEAATYLGFDAYTGNHFVKVGEGLRGSLVPITHFLAPAGSAAQLDDEVWGIGLRNKDEDFTPYVLSSRIAIISRLPNLTAITAEDVAGPGLPVFNRKGEFVGIAQNSFGQNYLLFSRGQNGTPILLVNVEESSVIELAPEVTEGFKRLPHQPSGRPISWFGVSGVQPVDPEVAKVLKLGKQSALVLSDLVEGSPAAQAGLQDGDIVIALDGQPLPHLKPDRVVALYFGQEMLRRSPGTVVDLTILRGSDRKEIKVTLGDEPRMVRESERRYFDRLGFTVREFLMVDRILNRAKISEEEGVVVNYVKPNGPAAVAGLRGDDWVREIDGAPVKTYAEAVAKLAAAEADKSRAEIVLLASRGGETQVLRLKLN
ncbi:MAG TPA: PDZ domain-containing protein [Candidatus Didemnitutus sp.]|nr:PDZ domain-containing protein [Candidatus Didemnitutus sp.]